MTHRSPSLMTTLRSLLAPATLVFALVLGLAPSLEALACHGWIKGYKCEDLNGDGVCQDDEPRLDGWQITLVRPNGGTTAVITGAGPWADGYFEFYFDLEGDYTLYETMQAGWYATGPASGQYTFTLMNDGTLVRTFANTRYGSLTVNKVVDWQGATPDMGQSFSICITGPSYPSPDCKSFDYDGGSETWSDLKIGAYTVTEADPGVLWTVSGNGVTVEVASGATAGATVTNTYDPPYGSLEVTKSVDWNGVTPVVSQTFEICITGPSYATPSCKTADYDGGTLTWTDLTPGDYTVTETEPGKSWTVAVPASAVAVSAGQTATASVTNTHTLGELEVTKTLDWNGATPEAGHEFTICVSGPSYSPADCKVFGDGNGWTQTWVDLIPGTYTVTEDLGVGSAWTVSAASQNVIVEAGATAQAGVTNTFRRGTLTVEKLVDWVDGPVDTSAAFLICIAGPSYPSGTEVGACQTADYDGATLVWSDLIVGSYTVTESDPGSGWIVTGSGVDVIVTSNGTPARATIGNARLLGGLDVTKTVTWGGRTPVDRDFEVCVQGPSYPQGDESGACQVIAYTAATDSATTASWDNLVPGNYTVTETDPNSFDNDEGYPWSQPEITYANALTSAVVVAGGRGSAHVHNQTTIATAVDLKGWTVVATSDGATISWTTTKEDAETQFRVYRSEGASQGSGTLVQAVNGQGSSGGHETAYSITDSGLSAGTYTYWLVEVTSAGEAQVAGPTTVVVGVAGQGLVPSVYVPLIRLR